MNKITPKIGGFSVGKVEAFTKSHDKDIRETVFTAHTKKGTVVISINDNISDLAIKEIKNTNGDIKFRTAMKGGTILNIKNKKGQSLKRTSPELIEKAEKFVKSLPTPIPDELKKVIKIERFRWVG